MVESFANVQGDKLVAVLPLIPSSGGGGGGGDTVNYTTQVTNKPKVNNVTLSGNKTSSDLGLQDALVSGTNIKTINNNSLLGSGDITITSDVTDVQINGTSVTTDGVANIPVAAQDTLGVSKVSPTYGLTVSNGIIVGSTKTESVYSTAANSLAICKGTLENIKDTYVRSVSPACTTLSGTTATITANTTYAHAVGSSGCVYTISTPTDTSTVYNGFILMLDTTNSASIAFQTDNTPAVTISISGNPTIQTGKKYTVTGQWDVLNNAWQLFIIDYSVS